MSHEELPVDPHSVPEAVRRYFAVVEAHRNRPFVRRHFHQVTPIAAREEGGSASTFFVLEFRKGLMAALAWQTDTNTWAFGRWLRLAHLEADITCPPTELTHDYFRGALTAPTFEDVLRDLATTVPV